MREPNEETCVVVVPWVTEPERAAFLRAWSIGDVCPPWLVLHQDKYREGCGITKNRGVARALELGAETVVVLDSDCYPQNGMHSLRALMSQHLAALVPQPVELFETVTDPPSRGTPYQEKSVVMPVAASMGFWTEVGDYCAVRQLTYGVEHPMAFRRKTIFGRYFPLCGMNVAFQPARWSPWCDFIDVPRFDDIWMGWLWQKEAYRRGWCFNLAGPLIRHSRQSNVWRNLEQEALNLQANETLWREIALSSETDYEALKALLPVTPKKEVERLLGSHVK